MELIKVFLILIVLVNVIFYNIDHVFVYYCKFKVVIMRLNYCKIK